MQGKVITQTKGGLDFKIHYKGMDTVYGLGGIHGAAKPGVYEAQPGWTIMTSDVTSFYPNLAIRNGFYPEHLPKKEFLELYEWFFEERKKIPKKDPKNYVYKIILNSTYGLSNDENSFLYDPKMTMQITINGQLQLSMLYEMLAEGIPGSIPLMQNTDGLEMMIPDAYVDKYMEICAEWEKICNLQLEHDEYSKLVLADVNNYIAIYKDGKAPKAKGRFEWEPQDQKKVAALHKNKSFLVIPKAIYNYFVYGISPEQSLKENRNIYDYCGGLKAKGQWYFEERYVDHGKVKINKLNKIVRYYISKKGVKLVKCNSKDHREMQVNAGRWLATTMNNTDGKHIDMDSQDIDKEYYLQAIYKEIMNIDSSVSRNFKQIEIFLNS
jgi:DNA polymerase elongation subunit (family B)